MRIVLLASVILQAIAIGMSFAENIGKEKQKIIDIQDGSCFWFT